MEDNNKILIYTGSDGLTKGIPFYNLDMIIALGYRVRYNALTK